MGGEGRPRPPGPLKPEHDVSAFDSGEPTLDDWLKRYAFKNEQEGASRTYVACIDRTVIAYYCLAVGGLSRSTVPGKVRRNMPDPIPVMVIGRLAVDRSWQGKGLGRALLRDAILRTVQAADIAGIRAILVHALSDEAKRFYTRCGFYPAPVDPLMLMTTLSEAKKALEAGSS